MKVYVTNTQYVDFSTSELFVTKRNINITSLTITSVGLFGAFTVPVIGLATPICKVTYDYGWDFSSVDEVLMHTEGKLYRAQNQFWNADAVVVKVDGVVQSSGITLDRVEGTVTFDASLDPDAVVTASYGYALPNEVSQATGLTVADFIGKKELQERGMSGVQSISVGEISIDRPRPRAATSNVSMDVPNEAQQLLQGLNFITIR
jgi:hypothetical protein